MSVTGTLHELGGVASIRSLKSRGLSEGVLRASVRTGLVVRVRGGWIAAHDAPPALVRAVQLGGRLGCVSAAAHLGAWTLDESSCVHVAVPHHAGRATAHHTADVVSHWQSENWSINPSPIESVSAIALQIAGCLTSELAVATLDSLLNRRILSLPELRRALTDGRVEEPKILTEIDVASQSGLESLTRVRLRRMGLGVRSQVEVAGVGHVDLMIGDRLVIETDGREWHNSPEAVARDYARDLRLTTLGFHVVRLSYEQVIFEWPLVELMIRELVSRGEHVRRP
jgi:very-short-patch-repair endonuclease